MLLSENCAKLYSVWDVIFSVHEHRLIIYPCCTLSVLL